MKNIGASVSAVLTQEKKEAEVEKAVVEEEEEEEEEKEEYYQMENEVIFCLDEAPEFQISGVAEWGENSQGDIMKELDTYFLHVLTGQRCESVWSCLTGWSEPDEKSMEKWETLCGRIEEHEKIEECIFYRKTISV